MADSGSVTTLIARIVLALAMAGALAACGAVPPELPPVDAPPSPPPEPEPLPLTEETEEEAQAQPATQPPIADTVPEAPPVVEAPPPMAVVPAPVEIPAAPPQPPQQLGALDWEPLAVPSTPLASESLGFLPFPSAPDATAPEPPVIWSPDAAARPRELMAALLLPLSAADPVLRRDAADMRDAAQLSLFEWGAPDVRLLLLDTGGDPAAAAAAARDALAEGARVILGPMLGASTKAVAVHARQAGAPVLSFSNTGAVAGGGVHILGLSPGAEVQRVADYARSQGHARLALVAPAGAYGHAVYRALAAGAAAPDNDPRDFGALGALAAVSEDSGGGWVIDRHVFYDPAATDFSAALDRLLDGVEPLPPDMPPEEPLPPLPFDAVIIAALDGNALKTMAGQLARRDAGPERVRYLGLSLWGGFDALEAEPPLRGAWHTAQPDRNWSSFATRFQDVYGRAPGAPAALAYEAVAIVSWLAARAAGGDVDLSLQNLPAFEGVRGVFRLDPSGLTARALVIQEVRPTGRRQVDPPPAP